MTAKPRIIPALLLSAMLLPLSVCAIKEGDYYYIVSGGKATITYFKHSYSGALSITNSLGGYPVTTIGNRAFRNRTSLTSVTIPDSVTSIGDYAFSNCKSLTSVTIPQHVKKIGSFVFYDCVSLTNILFTGNAPAIGDCVFSSTPATVYYLSGTAGWASTIAERPAVLWNHATPTP